MITLDLRGSGLAEPVLTCPEVTELNRGAFAAEIDETTPEGTGDASRRRSNSATTASSATVSTCPPTAPTTPPRISKTCASRSVSSSGTSSPASTAASSPRSSPATTPTVFAPSSSTRLRSRCRPTGSPTSPPTPPGAWDALVATCAADAGCAQAFPDLAEPLRSPGRRPHRQPSPLRRGRRLSAAAANRSWLTASRLLTVRALLRSRQQLLRAACRCSIAGPPGAEVAGDARPSIPTTPTP